MKLLLTCFEPFGGETVNASEQAVSALRAPGGMELKKLCLPTVFGRAGELLISELLREGPDAVVCVGQASGRAAVTPERVAINLRDARCPDNAGQRPVDEPILPGAPAAYFSTLPVKKMVAAIRERGLSAQLSYTAGSFVCNELMYRLLHELAVRKLDIPGGFIHVPALPEQRPEGPALTLEETVTALEAALTALI